MTIISAELELRWWHQNRDALLSLSGVGFEGGGVSVWDEARSARAHGFVLDERLAIATRLNSGLLSTRHREALRTAERTAARLAETPPETRRLLAAAWETCGASLLGRAD